MLQNYLKIAIRNISKNKLYAGINILGLAIGFSIAILIALYIFNEKSYEQWVPDKELVHRVYRQWGPEHQGTAWTPGPLAPALVQDFPEIQLAGCLSEYGRGLLEYRKNKLFVDNLAMIDSSFLQIIEVPFLFGNGLTAMNGPDKIILSKTLSQKIIGGMNPIGETIQFDGEIDLTVSGVLDDLPGNSHLFYDAYLSFLWDSPYWTGNNRATYVKVKATANPGELEQKITPRINEFIAQEYASDNTPYSADDFPTWKLQTLSSMHLDHKGFSHLGSNAGNPMFVKVFTWVAFLLLLIAGINYINLSTALATQRAKEVGIRKVSGATQTQLVSQFLIETIVKSLVAGVVAILLAELLLPTFNAITERQLVLLGDNLYWMLLPILGIAFLIGVLSGIYPAFVLSTFEPIKTLKSELNNFSGKQYFRKILVASQFVASIAFIIVIIFIFRQIHFMQAQDLGFSTEQVVVIPSGLGNTCEKVDNLKHEFLSIPGVSSIVTATGVPGNRLPDWDLTIEGGDSKYTPDVLFTSEGYDQTMGIQIKEGRFLRNDIVADSINNFVVNETFIRKYGIEDPVLGKKVKFSSEEEFGQIVGVVKDFHYRNLSVPINPLIINARPDPSRWYTTIKIATTDISSTLQSLEQQWQKIEPGLPMEYSFLDDDFNAQYAEHQRFAKSMLYATLLTIFIACLGLFGLATFSAQKRKKEIGIRRVLGATISQVVLLLSKDFLLLVFIASPFAWMITSTWLTDFAYRISIDWWVFALAGISAILIAFATISFQSIRAATSNPVESLKQE